jgi:hypothetical protein
MKVEDWFALAVRVIGVLILLYGIGYLLDSFLFRLGYFNFSESSPGYYLIAGLSYVLVGMYLIRGASHLVRFAFPAEAEDERQVEDENPDRRDT